mgnify:CR=1 FL=1
MNRTLILGIESSCDETSICVLENGRKILSNVIATQIPIHQKFGGVVPEIASRQHVEAIAPVLHEALEQAGVELHEIDAVAVTYGPGLVGALLVGLIFAKGLAFALDKPLIGVNHLEGHFYANYLCHEQLQPPFVALVVSGGHTSLLHVKDFNSFSILGQTRDDAAGEAFDKVARVLGLGYPGGPFVDEWAQKGDDQAIVFPKAKLDGRYDFSFSGLKSAVINYLHTAKQKGQEINKADVCACFQKAVVEAIADKCELALQDCQLDKLVMAGGVSANSCLRATLAGRLKATDAKLYYPTNVLCTDNAAMIACRGYYMYINGQYSDLSLNADPALKI